MIAIMKHCSYKDRVKEYINEGLEKACDGIQI